FHAEDALGDRAFDTIAHWRSKVPAEVRIETARAFAGRRVSAATLALFADEPAAVVGPLIADAALADEQWLALLPSLTPTARNLLRHRRDLSPQIMRALESFGPSDFAIPGYHQPEESVEQVELSELPEAPAEFSASDEEHEELQSAFEEVA